MDITASLKKLKKYARIGLETFTIEPMLFFRGFAYSSMNIVSENLKLDRFCRVQLGYSEETCANLNDGHHDEIQIEVQKLDNFFNFYQKVVGMVVPVLLISFIASWSDRRGRKIPLLMSLFGYILHARIYFLMSFFPSWPPQVLYVAAFCQTIGGGWMLFLMAAYSYIADHSETKARTYRMAVMNGIWALGSPTGTAVGTVIYDKAGYSWLFGFSFSIYILCFIYCVIVVKDKLQKAEENSESTKKYSPFHIKNVLDLFKTCFERRPGRGRLHILLLMSMMLSTSSSSGHNMYLWSMRVFYWSTDSYTLYDTVIQTCQNFAILIVTPFLKIFKIDDCIAGAGTALGRFIQMLTLGLLTNKSQEWVPYLFIVNPTNLCVIAIRSMLSKIVKPDEIGRVFSLLSILEVFWPIVDSAIFTGVYGATIDFYPSYEHLICAIFAFYLFSGFLGLRLSVNDQEIHDINEKLKHQQERNNVRNGHTNNSVKLALELESPGS